MKQTVNNSDFHNAFNRMDRGTQFSYEALNLIYDYLEEIDPNMELDVIAICCDFSEMHIADVFNSYPISCDSDSPTPEEVKSAVLNYLYAHTAVVGETDSAVVFQQF
jgi:hypothetical protein